MKVTDEFCGEIETHITVDLASDGEWPEFEFWCRARGLKCVYIALERGQTPAQPMLTRGANSTLKAEMEAAQHLAQKCQRAGWSVARVKLEVPPWNADVPADREEARAQTAGRYFEHHVKLLLPDDADLNVLKTAVVSRNAHLSRNARRVRRDGHQERFVTQRCYRVGRGEANAAFQALLQTLDILPFERIETEAEYVVYDSNFALDAGWIDP